MLTIIYEENGKAKTHLLDDGLKRKAAIIYGPSSTYLLTQIEEEHGKDFGTPNDQSLRDYLSEHGYSALADLLTPKQC